MSVHRSATPGLPGFSVIVVNYRAYDFLALLAESLERFMALPYQLIVVDNECPWPVPRQLDTGIYGSHVYIPNVRNEGHGAGLNQGARAARYEYTLFLDVDSHLIAAGWEERALARLHVSDVLAGPGVPEKPIRPACMMMPTRIAQAYDWRDTPGYRGHRLTPDGYDVAIKAYHEMVRDGLRIGFLDRHPSPYPTHHGECWGTAEAPFVYHHWHGAHLAQRQVDFESVDLLDDKASLFSAIPWRRAEQVL